MSTVHDSSETTIGSPGKPADRGAFFVTTHWSVVLAAGRNDTTRARVALEKLCQTYWYPMYAYVRQRGYTSQDAEDLTQGFFARLLAQQSFSRADPDRGRFRCYLLGAMKHWLAHEWAKTIAKKRGGGQVTLDFSGAGERFQLEAPACQWSPDQLFDRQWAMALLDQVLNRLEDEYRQGGKAALFEALKETLTGGRQEQPYAQLGKQLKMNEGAVKVAVHRLRKRYRELLQAEIAETVATPKEAREELQHLIQILAQPSQLL